MEWGSVTLLAARLWSVRSNRQQAEVGVTDVIFYVVDSSNDPVEGAIVTFNEESKLTGDNGQVTFHDVDATIIYQYEVAYPDSVDWFDGLQNLLHSSSKLGKMAWREEEQPALLEAVSSLLPISKMSWLESADPGFLELVVQSVALSLTWTEVIENE